MFTLLIKRIGLLFVIAGMAGSLATLTGCNTMEGVGQDTQELGESIEDKADENK